MAGLVLVGYGASATEPIGTVRVADGLEAPSYVVAPPDDFNRLFVVESQSCEILIMDLTTESIGAIPFLTVSVDGVSPDICTSIIATACTKASAVYRPSAACLT